MKQSKLIQWDTIPSNIRKLIMGQYDDYRKIMNEQGRDYELFATWALRQGYDLEN